MIAHAFNTLSKTAEAARSQVWASLIYIVSCRPARATKDSVSFITNYENLGSNEKQCAFH